MTEVHQLQATRANGLPIRADWWPQIPIVRRSMELRQHAQPSPSVRDQVANGVFELNGCRSPSEINAKCIYPSQVETHRPSMHNACMSYDDRPEPAKRLEQARKAAGYASAREAAARFNWVYESYVQHENGTRGISRVAARYAKAFKVSEAWLLTGEGHSPTDDDADLIAAIQHMDEAGKSALRAFIAHLESASRKSGG